MMQHANKFSCKNASNLNCCWHIDADDMGGGAVAMGARECIIVIVPPLRSWPLAMTSGASESFKHAPEEVSNKNVVRQFSKARNAREVVQANLLLCVLGMGDKRQCPPHPQIPRSMSDVDHTAVTLDV